MGFTEDQFYKDVVRELRSIRKSMEVIAKMAATQEKAEQVKLGLSPLLKDFPGGREIKDNDIIAVDFDGTLCENKWPDIGSPIYPVIEYLKERQARGARLILWTNRRDVPLDEAVYWCAEHGLVFDAVNDNLPDIIETFGGNSRKIFANEYLDDRAMPPEQIVRSICPDTYNNH